MAKKERHSLTRLTASFWSEIQAERKVTPQGGTADHTRETYLGGEEVRAKGVVGWQRGGGGGGTERGTTEQRHPSHAVAAQLHFATSILPARLHSHSVDPFTEGMSHTPSFSLPPVVFSPPPWSPRTPALLLTATPYGPGLRQSLTVLFLSSPVHPSPPSKLANVCPRSLPPSPPLCLPPAFPSLFLSRRLSLSFSFPLSFACTFYQSVPLSL